MSGRAAMLGLTGAAAPPPTGDTYGDTATGDENLVGRTAVEFDPAYPGGWVWEGNPTDHTVHAVVATGLRSFNGLAVSYCPDLGSSDMWAECEVTADGGINRGVAIRVSTDNTDCYYIERQASGQFRLRRYTGSSTTILQYNPGGGATGTIAVQASGDDFEFFWNGSSVATNTVASAVSGTRAGYFSTVNNAIGFQYNVRFGAGAYTP